MKSKLRSLELVSIGFVFGLMAYLIHLNMLVSDYEVTYNSNANYSQIENDVSISENILKEANFAAVPEIEFSRTEESVLYEYT